LFGSGGQLRRRDAVEAKAGEGLRLRH
jgi:hypothetical protein